MKFPLSSEGNYSSFKKLPYLSFCRSLLVLTSSRLQDPRPTFWVSGMASYDVDGTRDVNTPDQTAWQQDEQPKDGWKRLEDEHLLQINGGSLRQSLSWARVVCATIIMMTTPSSQLMLPPAPAAPLPLHKSTRPKELGSSPSPLSPPVVILLGSRFAFQEVPTVHATARLRPLPAERISPLSLKGETATCKHRITTTMTRTHKGNDRDHVGLANGTAVPEEHLPRYFGKAGFAGTNPAETKKKGSGKGNWGQAGISELEDYDYNSLKPRRRSNSMSLAAGHSALKTKFEAVDEDAIEFDEALHGPRDEDLGEMYTGALPRSGGLPMNCDV
ncbi:hypothetical protein D0863_16101 [Hortaea werneckii]|uniref:Hyaluronan/mRNA-binding protein domain-containing protein n=1 Tax=Hortaea werneckii TaxID=91943 RepID=A0A3M7C008_HORWE|nr:hypothetical protein D0863_16101 [Hortaea werneckii]